LSSIGPAVARRLPMGNSSCEPKVIINVIVELAALDTMNA
jgi:hypothetical protein